jgi:hypothetical protein
MINARVITQIFHTIDNSNDWKAVKETLDKYVEILSELTEHDLRETLTSMACVYKDRFNTFSEIGKIDTICHQIIHNINCFWYVWMKLTAIKKQAYTGYVWRTSDYRIAILQSIRVITSMQHGDLQWSKFVVGEKYNQSVDSYINRSSFGFEYKDFPVNMSKAYIPNNKTKISCRLYDHPFFNGLIVVMNDGNPDDVLLDMK